MTNIYAIQRIELAKNIAASFAELPEVEAITLGGSVSTGHARPNSDSDIYVYTRSAVPVTDRLRIIAPRASRSEVDNSWSEPEDAWIESASGIEVDMIYRSPAWIEEQLDRVLIRHEASIGYSTAFWHNVRCSMRLFDHNGWFAKLQGRANQAYPEQLAQAIIKANHRILRSVIFSWLNQLDDAAGKNDLPLISQKLAKLFASYFDVIFAANSMTHPGEKRMVQLATSCPKHPESMSEQIQELVRTAYSDPDNVKAAGNALFDNLDQMLRESGLIS